MPSKELDNMNTPVIIAKLQHPSIAFIPSAARKVAHVMDIVFAVPGICRSITVAAMATGRWPSDMSCKSSRRWWYMSSPTVKCPSFTCWSRSKAIPFLDRVWKHQSARRQWYRALSVRTFCCWWQLRHANFQEDITYMEPVFHWHGWTSLRDSFTEWHSGQNRGSTAGVIANETIAMATENNGEVTMAGWQLTGGCQNGCRSEKMEQHICRLTKLTDLSSMCHQPKMKTNLMLQRWKWCPIFPSLKPFHDHSVDVWNPAIERIAELQNCTPEIG